MMIIDPKKHTGNSALIQKMLTNYQRQYGHAVSMADLKNSTIIIAYDRHRGIRGGAWLTPKPVLHLSSEMKSQLNSKAKRQQYWECAGIHFILDENDPALVHVSNLRSLKQIFYEDLYECLINFGLIQNVAAVVTVSSAAEHKNLKQIGKWPLLLESPSKTVPDMIHGLVPITMDAQDLYHAKLEERRRALG